ncbi:F-box domain-containing protein [Mycena venus]|uniref:F-box domain-containing protein n=1 Tax=Mycena venus TaxID=2733690 RepID=A0A8H6XS96_9AGAR|nr:F-box domain-containing protein [Mycena venus]
MDAFRCSQCGALSSNPSTAAFDISVAAGMRYYTLLHTNEPPEHFETPFIHSVIAKTEARLQCIDDEISKLQEKLDQLEKERASLTGYRTQNNGILSPLRRFPPEVLGEIFSRTLPSLDDEWDRGRFSTEHSPWLLTHINSRWRTIALSTPSLWSQVLIAYTQARDPLTSAYPLSLAEAQLQCAHTLKIHFDGRENGDSRTQIQMFQLLSQHCSKWEELSLFLTSEIAPLLTALRGRLSSLRRLWIQWDPDDHHASDIRTTVESLDCFLTASSLVDVGVNDICRLASTVFPIQQLTRYELFGPWEQHKYVLKLAPNLIEARIQIEFDEEDEKDEGGSFICCTFGACIYRVHDS